MNKPATIDVLNRLLRVECSSLPRYLLGTSPWRHAGDELAWETIEHIAGDQGHMAGRIAELVMDRGGLPDSCVFPMEFTDLNMLSLDFLVSELIRTERRDIAEIETCVRLLEGDHEARVLAEEVLGCERGHVESLEELEARPVA